MLASEDVTPLPVLLTTSQGRAWHSVEFTADAMSGAVRNTIWRAREQFTRVDGVCEAIYAVYCTSTATPSSRSDGKLGTEEK